jgi:hypothetical protein
MAFSFLPTTLTSPTHNRSRYVITIHSIIHSFYLAFIIATTVTLEQVTSLNTSFLKSFCPNAYIRLRDVSRIPF